MVMAKGLRQTSGERMRLYCSSQAAYAIASAEDRRTGDALMALYDIKVCEMSGSGLSEAAFTYRAVTEGDLPSTFSSLPTPPMSGRSA